MEYCLLDKFQSTIDRGMPERLMGYSALLYQDRMRGPNAYKAAVLDPTVQPGGRLF